MKRAWWSHGSAALVAGLWLLTRAAVGLAAELRVTGADDLQAVIRDAGPGDRIVLLPGRHTGPIIIDRTLALVGDGGAIIDGGGRGRVVQVDAPDAEVRGVTVVNSGESLAEEDAGIYVTAKADRALITGNRLENNLIGIYLKGPEQARVVDNVIIGRTDLRMNERGNGIHLWNTPGSVIEGNIVQYGRDGIFVTTSENNVFRNNRLTDLRFAVHYMYTNDSEVSGNYSADNHMAYALMYSSRLKVYDNVSARDRDRGLLLNYANESDIRRNRVLPGPEKCVFIYNANINTIADNWFEGCEIGIHFTAGSERNRLYGNAFVNSRNQVKYVGTRLIEWSDSGRGNYWSDNLSYDLNGDGIADEAYRPNGLIDHVVWRFPMSKFLLNSPAWHVLLWAQSHFPALHPGGVIDRAPLMTPPGSAGG